uniref:diaminopimelate epimerase n=1 Tax=Pararhizobium sp. IMCC3301 TaxID=3067904 RepID=UPI002741B8A9|nr:diaminopimelate epimerase [Pararhizobium sp. IMCC3301]
MAFDTQTIMDGIRYYKMNGAGNEIVMLDLRDQSVVVTPEAARAIAARSASFFDQLMVLLPPKTAGTAAFVEIWNNDGSRSGACGNGTRCIAAMELDRLGTDTVSFETEAGLLPTSRAGTGISVDMGVPKFGWADIPLSQPMPDTNAIELDYEGHGVRLSNPAVANMGNPHAVFWVDDPQIYDLSLIGPELEQHPLFPEKANISLAQIISPEAIRLRVWERGAGETRACGSAACAVAVSAARSGRTGRDVRIHLPGGALRLVWRDDDHVVMTGPWELEHAGSLPVTLFDASDHIEDVA